VIVDIGREGTKNKNPALGLPTRGKLIYHKKDVSYSESPKQDRTLDIFGFSEVADLKPYLFGFT